MIKRKILENIPDYCVLSGSRGFGKPTEDSDWDYYVPEEKWEEFKEWFFRTFKGKEIDSCVTGHLSVRLSPKHSDLIEFSIIFPKNWQEYERTNHD